MKNYFRQFITLTQDRPGYSLPGREVAGRIVIESRDGVGKASLYIQFISPQHNYKLVFIAKGGDGNIGVSLGHIVACEKGRYEGKFEFEPNNIGGSGMTCRDIDGVAVLVNNAEDMTAALVGYKGQPFSWRVNLRFGEAADEEVITEDEEVITEAAVHEVEEVPASVYDIEHDANLQGWGKVSAENKAEEAYAAPVDIAAPYDIATLFEVSDTVEVFKEYDENDCGFNSNIKWIVAGLQDITALSCVGDCIKNNACVHDSFNKYKHLLLGEIETEGQSEYILGIPDVYCEERAPLVLEEFEVFKQFKVGELDAGAHGYWLKRLG